jgi:hypothetical protein
MPVPERYVNHRIKIPFIVKETSVLLAILATIFILISAACAGCSSKVPSAPVVTPSAAPLLPITPPVSAGDPGILTVSIGETAANPERQVTVYSVQKSTYYTPYQEYAGAGNAFVIVDAEEKNTGAEYFVSILPSTLTLTNADGTVTYGSKGYADVIKTLVRGQSVRGIILYTVPEDAKNLTLSYKFGNVSGGPSRADWYLTLP